jgi:CheY-like chemotaxis protein
MFTDVGLPGMNGLELARRVQGLLPRLKVIFTSGYAQTRLAELGLTGSGVRILPKPFRVEAFARIMRSALDEA